MELLPAPVYQPTAQTLPDAWRFWVRWVAGQFDFLCGLCGSSLRSLRLSFAFPEANQNLNREGHKDKSTQSS
jgi:hypothetical protein